MLWYEMRHYIGDLFLPGLVRQYVDFCHDIILPDHPHWDMLVLYLPNGVGLHDLQISEYRVIRRLTARMMWAGYQERWSKTVSRHCSLGLWTQRYKPA